ncbi:copper chaperone PCu(A)C [Diaphorobacter sp.]|uniref:copper chaperone PCu(A)C n=1 Tax=Diaphorobacter sp. TaxID=1934310 RepID=UPI0028ADD9D8|nr:copper chaperone PCu(A)C [Diaphorobacter sp.]
MKLKLISLVASSLLFAGAAAHAEVTVKDAWVRATVAQQKATGAFMVLQADADSKLLSASSTITPVVEVHEMAMDNNVMKMREVKSVNLPAGKPVELKPGGLHIMLMDLKSQVKAGDVVPLTLTVEDKAGKRETIQIQAEVRALNTPAAPAAGHDSHSGH